MDTVQSGLRYAFQTTNLATLAVPGTGHAGMEAALANLVEAGEVVFVLDETGEETTVVVGARHVIVPEERHSVRPGPGARFHVQFWAVRQKGAAADRLV